MPRKSPISNYMAAFTSLSPAHPLAGHLSYPIEVPIRSELSKPPPLSLSFSLLLFHLLNFLFILTLIDFY